MSQYAIAELAEEEAGGFEARGAIKDLWESRDFEIMVSGPADCGKTYGFCQYIDALLWEFPGAQGVIGRKTYSALVTSALQSYKRVIGYDGPNCPIKAYGGEKPEWFDYPNGSRLWTAGLDNPGKALSSERDFFYFVQAEELDLNDWETVLTRASGRGAVMPYTRVMGDCNPGPTSHWILHRDTLKVLYARHEDNPTLYSADGKLLPEGKKRLAILDSLTGVRYQRLRLGKWVQAEGAVYEAFDRAVHILSREQLIERGVFLPDGRLNRNKIKKVVAGQDWGYTNPGVLLVSAVDGNGVNYCIHEVYQSHRLIDWWSATLVRLVREYGIDSIDCDPAEPAFIEAYRNALTESRLFCTVNEGINDISPGIDAVQQLLAKRPESLPRLYFYADMLEQQDEELVTAKQPTSSLQEFEIYVWPKGVDGKPVKEKPVDAYNHGCFVAGTLIETIDGPVPVENVRIGTLVLTREGYRKVLVSGCTDASSQVLTVTFSDGRTLTGTGNHPVFVVGKGFVPMDTLRYTDSILDIGENIHWRLSDCRPTVKKSNEFVLTELFTDVIQWQNGFLIGSISECLLQINLKGIVRFTEIFISTLLEIFRKDTRFITKTKTLSIMLLKTSNALLRWSIVKSMSRLLDNVRLLPTSLQKPLNELICSKKRQIGIVLMKAVNGIDNTARRFSEISHRLIGSVKFAVPFTKPWRFGGIIPGFVPIIASLNGDGCRAQIISSPFASIVGKRLGATDTKSESSAQDNAAQNVVSVVRKHNHSELHAVYNLTVEGEPEYYANGVLVHNCDTLRYLCMRQFGQQNVTIVSNYYTGKPQRRRGEF